jgi:hypothetical protein
MKINRIAFEVLGTKQLLRRDQNEPSWIAIIHIFISACTSWLWLSESCSFNFQFDVCEKMWELVSDAGIVFSFEKFSKSDGNGPWGLMSTHLSFSREWFGRRTNMILKATIKIYKLMWKYKWLLFRKVPFDPPITPASFLFHVQRILSYFDRIEFNSK